MNRGRTGRKAVVAVAAVATLSMIVASCTLPKPSARTWRVKADSIEIVDQKDYDAGDEPYVIQLGFRSKLAVPNSSNAWVISQCTNGTGMPAPNIGAEGTTYTYPPRAADIVFPEATNLDIGDVLLGTAPLEIFGTLSFLMERDTNLTTCAWTELINNVIPPLLRDSLNLLIAGSAVPPTEQQLVDLIVAQIDNLLLAIPGFIGIAIEGAFGGQDDLLGVVAQIHLPTKGVFKDLLDFGFNLLGIDNGVLPIAELGDNFKFRVGHLLPSSAVIDISGEVNFSPFHVRYKSVVGP
jgi:hypothetical protein